MLVDSPSRPISSRAPGLVTTKLCGMMSPFSKTTSTGLPAWAAIRSLSKSIWSVTVPSRITRTPRSPSSRLAFDARSAGRSPASESASCRASSAAGRCPVAGRDRLRRRRAGRRASGRPRRPASRRRGSCEIARIAAVRSEPLASDELREGLEGLGLLAPDRGQRDHRRSSERPLGAGPADLGDGHRPWGRQVVGLEDGPSASVEDLERVPVEPLVEVAVGPVGDGDRLDREFGAEVDLPPGVRRVLLGVGLAAVAVVAALVAVDGPIGGAAVGRVLLAGLAERGDVPAVAEDFDLGQRQGPPRPRSSTRTNRPSIPFEAFGPPSEFGRPSRSGRTRG